MKAAGLYVQGLYCASGTPDEEGSPQNCGCREGGDVAWETKGPFQLKVTNLPDREPGLLGRLIAHVQRRWAPPIPTSGRRAGQGMLAGGAEGAGWKSLLVRRCSQKLGHGFTLFAVERVGHAHHQSKVQGSQDASRRHRLDNVTRRCPRTHLIVTCCAMLLINLRSRNRE